MADQQCAIRQADVDELETVMGLFKERIDWLRARRSDQWSTWETWQAKIQPAIEQGHVWLLMDGDDPIGTITVEFQGDRDFWTENECTEPAAYLSKLAVRLDYAGRELGALMTDWASDHAYRRGCMFVRLDAWKTNDQLHAYYADRGWKYLRTVDNLGRNSGSLFQLPVRPLSRRQRSRLREVAPVTVLQGTRSGPETLDPDAAGNWHARHVHRGGMRVKYDVSENPCEAMFIDFMRYRLRHDDQIWHLEAADWHVANWRHEAVVLGVDVQLSEAESYVVTHQETTDSCRMIVTSVPPELATVCVGARCAAPTDH
jgi:GNAT superfamily N-acetyltransferase